MCLFFIGPMLHHPPRSQTCVGNKPGGKPFALVEKGIHYQYTHIEWKSDPLPISAFNTVQFNSGQNSFTLNTSVPQPPPSNTYKIKWLEIVPPIEIAYIRKKRNIQVLRHDKMSRLIASGLPDRPSDQITA